jgi:hypothetical protein
MFGSGVAKGVLEGSMTLPRGRNRRKDSGEEQDQLTRTPSDSLLALRGTVREA